MTWLARNAASIEAVAATVTALVAVGAMAGVFLQLNEADRMQREQSASEAYRANLALAATLPNFAQPLGVCDLLRPDTAYSLPSSQHKCVQRQPTLNLLENLRQNLNEMWQTAPLKSFR